MSFYSVLIKDEPWFLTATFALTCFITLAVLTRDEILKSLI